MANAEIIVVGAGVSGIGAAIRLRQEGHRDILVLVNRLWAAFIWRLVRRNHDADFAILRWMRPVAKDLWSAADGPTVRAYRRFYRRNLAPPEPTTSR